MRVASERWSGKTGIEIFMCKVDISILRTTLRLWSNWPKRSMYACWLTTYILLLIVQCPCNSLTVTASFKSCSFIHSFIHCLPGQWLDLLACLVAPSGAGHRPSFSIHFCLMPPPPSSSAFPWILLSPFLTLDLFSEYSVVAPFLRWPCGFYCIACFPG